MEEGQEATVSLAFKARDLALSATGPEPPCLCPRPPLSPAVSDLDSNHTQSIFPPGAQGAS